MAKPRQKKAKAPTVRQRLEEADRAASLYADAAQYWNGEFQTACSKNLKLTFENVMLHKKIYDLKKEALAKLDAMEAELVLHKQGLSGLTQSYDTLVISHKRIVESLEQELYTTRKEANRLGVQNEIMQIMIGSVTGVKP